MTVRLVEVELKIIKNKTKKTTKVRIKENNDGTKLLTGKKKKKKTQLHRKDEMTFAAFIFFLILPLFIQSDY